MFKHIILSLGILLNTTSHAFLSSNLGGVIGGNISGATAGSVLFSGTSGVLTQDNSSFFWDDTNNRLAIGTNVTSTDAKLILQTATGANFTPAVYMVKAGGFGESALQNYYTDAGNYGIGLSVNSDTKLVVNVAGYTGIATTAPTARLDIAGTSATTDFRISRTVSPSTYLSITAPGGSPSTSIFGVTGVDVMSLNASGSVGIGTTSPNANAILDLTSTTKPFMPPRMTTTQRDAVSSPTAGMLIYNTTTNKLNVYTTAWEAVTSI